MKFTVLFTVYICLFFCYLLVNKSFFLGSRPWSNSHCKVYSAIHFTYIIHSFLICWLIKGSCNALGPVQTCTSRHVPYTTRNLALRTHTHTLNREGNMVTVELMSASRFGD